MTQMLQNVKTICNNFFIWINTHNRTQQEIAEELGVTRSHLNKVLHGKANPSIQLLEKIEQLMEE